PPETGASIIVRPRSTAAAATRRAASGAMVEQSISSVPVFALARMPLSPRYADSTCRLAGSMVIATSAAATAFMLSVSVLPPPATNLSTFAGTRSWPLTLKPARTKFSAIGSPMLPRPRNATSVLIILLRRRRRLLQRDGGVDLALLRVRREPARGHGFGLRPEIHRLLAVRPEVAELRAARAGETEIGRGYRYRNVDTHLADVDFVLELARRPAGRREERGAVAVGVRVDESDRLIERVDAGDAQHRAEDLLRVDFHAGLHAAEDRRSDEIAVGTTFDLTTAAVEQELRPFLRAGRDEALDPSFGGSRHQRTEIGAAIDAGTDLELARALDDIRQPFLGFADQHEHRIRHATLTRRAERGSDDVVDRLVFVRVRQNHAMVLRAHHRLRALSGFGGPAVNLRADTRRADERDGLDVRVLAKATRHVGAAMNHVQHARREPGVMSQLHQHQRGRGVLLGRFQHKGVAAGDGDGKHPAGQHHRKVKGRDARAYAERLLEGIDIDPGRRVF